MPYLQGIPISPARVSPARPLDTLPPPKPQVGSKGRGSCRRGGDVDTRWIPEELFISSRNGYGNLMLWDNETGDSEYTTFHILTFDLTSLVEYTIGFKAKVRCALKKQWFEMLNAKQWKHNNGRKSNATAATAIWTRQSLKKHTFYWFKIEAARCRQMPPDAARGRRRSPQPLKNHWFYNKSEKSRLFPPRGV